MRPQEQKVLRMERDRARIEAVGRIRTEALGLRVRASAIAAWTKTGDPGYVTMAISRLLVANFGPESLVGIVAAGMAAGHLAGIDRVQRTLHERGTVSRGIRLSSAYDNALKFLKNRTGMTSEQITQLKQRYTDVAVKPVMDVATGVIDKVNTALYESINEGAGVKQGVEKLRDAFNAAGVTPGANYQLENLFRTQTQLAYSAGRMNSLDDPAVQEILWGFQYATVGDDRVRPTHMAMDGHKAPKDDPVWETWTPPNGYNCRCAILEVFDKGTASERTPDVQPDKGFDFNPGDLTQDLSVAPDDLLHSTRRRPTE